jgi:regulator of sigma E protease
VEVERWTSIHHDIVVNETRVIQVEREGKILDIDVPEGMTSKLLKLERAIEPRIPCEIALLGEDGGLLKAGAQLGDRIVEVDGKKISFYDEFIAHTNRAANTTFNLGLLRGADTVRINVQTNEEGMFGFAPAFYLDFYETVVVRYSLLQSIPAGINRGVDISKSYLKQLKMLFKPETKAYEELGGFIKIGSIFPSKWNWESFWNMTAFLSIILAIMNVLPIPALDGGHVMFLLFEMISGRKPGDRFLEYAQIVGMVILLSLLLYANLNDIIGLFNR